MDIVQLAKNYKEAQKALAKARKALMAAMDKDAREAGPLKAKKAPPKPKKVTPPKPKKAPPKAKKTPPPKPKKAPPKAKKQPKSSWAPYRATLLKKMTKGQWITGFDARLFSGHEQGRGFTQNVLNHLLTNGALKKRKVKNTTQWCLK